MNYDGIHNIIHLGYYRLKAGALTTLLHGKTKLNPAVNYADDKLAVSYAVSPANCWFVDPHADFIGHESTHIKSDGIHPPIPALCHGKEDLESNGCGGNVPVVDSSPRAFANGPVRSRKGLEGGAAEWPRLLIIPGASIMKRSHLIAAAAIYRGHRAAGVSRARQRRRPVRLRRRELPAIMRARGNFFGSTSYFREDLDLKKVIGKNLEIESIIGLIEGA